LVKIGVTFDWQKKQLSGVPQGKGKCTATVPVSKLLSCIILQCYDTVGWVI